MLLDRKTEEKLKGVLKALDTIDKKSILNNFPIYDSINGGKHDYNYEFTVQLLNLDTSPNETENIIYKKHISEKGSIDWIYEIPGFVRDYKMVFYDKRGIPQISTALDVDEKQVKKLFKKINPIIDVRKIKICVQENLPI